MALKQSTLEEIVESERELVRTADQRYGSYSWHARDCVVLPFTSDPGSRLIRPATYASTASAALSGACGSVDLARAGEPARLLGRERFHGGARGRVVLLEFSRWRSAALSGAVTALSRDLRRGGEDEQRGESDPGRGTHLLVSCGPGPPDHRRLDPSKRLCAASVRAAAPAPPPRGRAGL